MGSWSKRLAAVAVAAATALAGCGGGESAAPLLPAAAPARSFGLADFQPAATAPTGKKTDVSFEIQKPDGKALTDYAQGNGPHTGVHVLFVRDDLSTIIHRHPPIEADGTIDDKLTFKDPGRYRVVVDAYPTATGSLKNFQLFRWLDVAGTAKTTPLPPFKASQVVDGYTFTMESEPHLKAVEAALLKVTVTDPKGKPAEFTPVLRRARARDLLPRRLAGLLPHPRLRARAPRAARARSAAPRSPARRAPPATWRSACCCRSRAPGGCSSRPRWTGAC